MLTGRSLCHDLRPFILSGIEVYTCAHSPSPNINMFGPSGSLPVRHNRFRRCVNKSTGHVEDPADSSLCSSIRT